MWGFLLAIKWLNHYAVKSYKKAINTATSQTVGVQSGVVAQVFSPCGMPGHFLLISKQINKLVYK